LLSGSISRPFIRGLFGTPPRHADQIVSTICWTEVQIVATIDFMIESGPFVWDEAKRAANLAAHGVDFAEAHRFDWDNAQFILDARRDYGETRVLALGRIERRLHVLVFTRRGASIRIISLRKANDKEIRRYEEIESQS
jgi:uncharacterized DUF497 family protein